MLQCYLGTGLYYCLVTVIGSKSLNNTSIQDLKSFNFFYHFFLCERSFQNLTLLKIVNNWLLKNVKIPPNDH